MRGRGKGGVLAVVAAIALLAACTPEPPPDPPPPAPPPPAWHFEDLDGPGVAGPGRTTTGLEQGGVISVVYGGKLHVFVVSDGTPVTGRVLRHLVYDGSTWTFESLDGGDTAGGAGRTADPIASVSNAVVVGSTLHVFYLDQTSAEIRHATFDGTTWSFEVVTTSGDRAQQIASAVSLGGILHLFFARVVLPTPGLLGMVHGWRDGSGWHFEDLDGYGVTGGNGRTDASVGYSPIAISDGTTVDLVYDDQGNHVRYARFDGSTWTFSSAGLLQVRPTHLERLGNTLHIIGYNPAFIHVDHLWNDGSGWNNEFLADHFGGGVCETNSNGQSAAALFLGTTLEVYVKGNSEQLCQASNASGTWVTSAWSYTALDGQFAGTGDGRTDRVTPTEISAIVFAGHRHVFYVDGDDGNAVPPHFGTHRLRHASL